MHHATSLIVLHNTVDVLYHPNRHEYCRLRILDHIFSNTVAAVVLVPNIRTYNYVSKNLHIVTNVVVHIIIRMYVAT